MKINNNNLGERSLAQSNEVLLEHYTKIRDLDPIRLVEYGYKTYIFYKRGITTYGYMHLEGNRIQESFKIGKKDVHTKGMTSSSPRNVTE